MSDPRVLLVDYDPRSTESMQRALTEAGFQVEIATDGLAGLEAFRRSRPALTIVEAMIPRKHGFEICEEIKALPQGHASPVIITSASYRGRNARDQAMKSHHCDEYLEKPIAAAQLVDVCRRLLGLLEDAEPAETDPAPGPSLDEMDEEELLAQLDDLLPPDADPTAGEAQEAAAGERPSRVFESPDDAIAALMEGDDEGDGESDSPGEQEIVSQLERVLTTQAEERSTPAPGTESPPKAESPPAAATKPERPADAPRAEATNAVSKTVAAPVAPPARPGPPPAPPVIAQTEQVAPSRTEPAPEVPAPEPASGGRRWIISATLVVAGLAGGAIWFFGGFGAKPEPVTSPASDKARQRQVQLPLVTRTARGLAPESANPVPAGPGSTTDSAPDPMSAAEPLEPRARIQAPPAREPEAASTADGTQTRPAPELVPPKTAPGTAEPQPTKTPRVTAQPEPEPAKTPRLTGKPEPPPAKSARMTEEPEPPPAKAARMTAEPEPGPTKTARVTAEPEPGPTKTARVTAEPEPAKPETARGTTGPEPAKPETARGTTGPEPTPAQPSPAAPKADSSASRTQRPDPARPFVPSWTRSSPAEPVARQTAAEPEPKARRGEMFPLDEVDVPPVAVRQPAPPYPAAARRMKQEGMVLFELLIDEEGRVIETRQTGGDAGRVLVNAALEAGAQWTFRPAMKDGVPVRVWKPAQVEFRP